MTQDRSRFLSLLESQQYPCRYLHKFIGRNTPAFRLSVEKLEARFTTLTRTGARQSGETHSYVAYTYELMAETPQDILAVLEATSKLDDLTHIL